MTAPQIASAQPTFLQSDRTLARAVRPFVRFSHIEAAGGIVLVAATVVALVWANSPWNDGYESLWATQVRFEFGLYVFDEDLGHVVNDLLMAVFFFVVGMEIKGELVVGELRDRRAVALPAMAALGGMVVPAAVFLAFNAGGAGSQGWGIPMATDIAFALGIVALLGSRVPPAVKVLLLTLAIVDDIGAIVVIAIFYTDRVEFTYVIAAVAIAALVTLMHRARVVYPPIIAIAGFALWLAVYESGVHATIAGVVMGLLTSARPIQSELEAEELVNVLENDDDIRADEVRADVVHLDPRVRLCLRPTDRRSTPVDGVSHRADLRPRQRRHRALDRFDHISFRSDGRRRRRARCRQVHRCRPVQLDRSPLGLRSATGGSQMGARDGRRCGRRCRLHGVVVHHRLGLRRRRHPRRRQDRHPRRLDHRCAGRSRNSRRGGPPTKPDTTQRQHRGLIATHKETPMEGRQRSGVRARRRRTELRHNNASGIAGILKPRQPNGLAFVYLGTSMAIALIALALRDPNPTCEQTGPPKLSPLRFPDRPEICTIHVPTQR